MINKVISRPIPTAAFLTLLIGALPASGANFLKDISVQKAGDTAVVVISTTQPCEYDTLMLTGKPERIVIDLSDVTNAWTQKKYMSLPFSSIKSVRTSQFQKEPLVTRVVLDIDRPVQFNTARTGNDIIVKIPAAPGESDFEAWHVTGASAGAPTRSVVSAPVEEAAAPAEEVETRTSSPEPPPPPPAEETKMAPKRTSGGVQIEAYPKRKVVTYSTSNFRDPFMPLVGAATGHMSSEIPILENLTLVGILQDMEANWALLEDSEGNGYMLTANDKVKNGYVVSVTDTKAIFQITEYGWTRTVALELNIPELR